MTSAIAVVGAGPTTIYTLRALIERASAPFDLTIFEEQASVGRGTPYRPGWNDPAMLSNIASVEIPPLVDNLDAPPITRTAGTLWYGAGYGAHRILRLCRNSTHFWSKS